MKTAEQWLNQYGESHQNPLNKRIHWICVPLIVMSLLGLLSYVPIPFGPTWLNGATLFAGLALSWYYNVSPRLALGMIPVAAIMLLGITILAALPIPLWCSCAFVFVGAWVGQFIGHKIEGKKPSFLEDVQFLLVGPLWLLGHVYRQLGWRY